MDKTKIDWCDSTWNPVTGCLHGCEYCYARWIAKRFGGWTDSDGDMYHDEFFKNKSEIRELDKPLQVFREGQSIFSGKWQNAPYPYDFIPTLHRYRLNDYIDKKGRNIFVCSMADLFGDWVLDSWIEEVFKACEKAQQHNYLLLTKNPKRYTELKNRKKIIKKDNMWYGTSITDGKSLLRFSNCYSKMNFSVNLFLSIEPILSDISKTAIWNECIELYKIGWVIIGAETGKRKNKVVPKRKWIERIVSDCYVNNVPLFMKSSLLEIWGKPLVQEFPYGLIKNKRMFGGGRK